MKMLKEALIFSSLVKIIHALLSTLFIMHFPILRKKYVNLMYPTEYYFNFHSF